MIDLNSKNYRLKNWGFLNYYESDLIDLLSVEKKIIDNTRDFCKQQIIEFKSKINNDSQLKIKPKNYEEGSFQSQYYQHFYGDTEKMITELMQSHRRASVLSLFSILEGQMKLISDLIESEFDLEMTLSQIHSNGSINKYWTYLISVYQIDDKNLKKSYNKIHQQKYIKNIISHNNSEIKKKKVKFVKSTSGLNVKKIGEDSFLIIRDEYITFLHDLIKDFLKSLIIEVDKKYADLKNVG